ncbi:hypothetical protein [Kitasatospora aureofaciens]|uniref:hypothetical protein n=1 Tax=Kitasatospora aureofaciens TaxID=1894 RepID=UPI000AB8C00A|nr:hypothetical protein [Kitasatospora aureofaciens]
MRTAPAPRALTGFSRIDSALELTDQQLGTLKGSGADHDLLAAWLAGSWPGETAPDDGDVKAASPWPTSNPLAQVDGEGRFEVVRLLTPVASAATARLLQAGIPVGPVLANHPRRCWELLCVPGAADEIALYGAVCWGSTLVCPRPGRAARGRSWLSVPPPGVLTRPADLVAALLADAPTLRGVA